MNIEFSTFVMPCDPELTTAHARDFKRRLKQGLIHPELDATPFDDLANERDRPVPYGIFSGLRPGQFLPGHEKRRRRIGMGDERMERLRYFRPPVE